MKIRIHSKPPSAAMTRAQRIFQRLVICLYLVTLALVAAALTMRIAVHGTEVQVPDLTSMPVTDAVRRAAAEHLNATVADHFYSSTVPAGSIVSQTPAAGETVRRDWIVRLVVSLGPQKISIPSVIGLSQRDATLAIREAHLDLGNIAVLPYPAAKPGTVIAQDPPGEDKSVDRPRVSLLVAAQPD
jgi:beta-lactam-binding protein with PASTA domain